jgi:hypothetical protein
MRASETAALVRERRDGGAQDALLAGTAAGGGVTHMPLRTSHS